MSSRFSAFWIWTWNIRLFFNLKEDPVTILLGWAGCQDKHLAKYSYIYKNQGCVVLRYPTPWQEIFFPGIFSKNLHYTARKLLDLLFDIGIEEHPILFHVFSNAGSMLYCRIVELFNQPETKYAKLNVVGAIFDSAPGDKNLLGGIRALNTVLRPSINIFARCFAILIFTLTAFFRVLFYPVTRFISLSFYDALKAEPSRWPQLFLYSKADEIISYKDIERMIKARKLLNIEVQSMDFITSQHVSHFKMFPDKYSSKCISFFKRCIQLHLTDSLRKNLMQ
ncbi:transmembrane protein 53 isoform X1 [Hypanus sabinus]|uniref:transmembrane protein 53 isoform X1 n=1 Tax=Hypanus sabinus TaxID=79690 RepID=UPI0028C4B5FB|nr:transmembrane protein 53 isoform X1 [Hypanus sabinus]